MGVAIELGMESGSDRYVEPARRIEGGSTERAFGCDIERMRSVVAPEPHQSRLGRDAEAQVAIHRQGNAGDQTLVAYSVTAGALTGELARANDLNPMSGLAQGLFIALQGVGDAVDFRRVGFGDEGDS